MVVTNPSIPKLSAFAKYARPRPPFFLFLSIIFELIYWPMLLISLLIGVGLIYTEGIGAFIQLTSSAFVLVYCGLIIALGRWRKRFRVNTPKVLNSETRIPILYLRSFFYESIDKSNTGLQERRSNLYEKETDDELLALALRDVGPLIAIAKPSDKIPPLGALRLYFKDEEWQEQVEVLMLMSQLVIIQSGYTEGTDWEMQRVRNLLPPEKVIFSFLSWRDLDRESRQLEYDIFAIQVKRIYGCDLPEKIGSAYFFYFDKEWKPHLIRLTGWKAIFFWICSIPSIVWHLCASIFLLIPNFLTKKDIWLGLLRRLPAPRIFREHSVPSVREALRPTLKERGVRLSIWRTAAFIFLVVTVGLFVLMELYGWPLIVLLGLVIGFLIGDYLQGVESSSSFNSRLQSLSLSSHPTTDARSKTNDVVEDHETKYKKCVDCGLGNWHEATTCERCGRTLERI